jgi:hypothetical protein
MDVAASWPAGALGGVDRAVGLSLLPPIVPAPVAAPSSATRQDMPAGEAVLVTGEAAGGGHHHLRPFRGRGGLRRERAADAAFFTENGRVGSAAGGKLGEDLPRHTPPLGLQHLRGCRRLHVARLGDALLAMELDSVGQRLRMRIRWPRPCDTRRR